MYNSNSNIMKKNFTSVNMLFAAIGALLMVVPLSAQEWDNVEPMDSLPVTAPWRDRDDALQYSSIVQDPEHAFNNVLKINLISSEYTRGSFRYDWRLSEESGTPEEDRNALHGITVVFRAKPTTEVLNYAQEYPDSSYWWWFVSIRPGGPPWWMPEMRASRDTVELIGCEGIPGIDPSSKYFAIDTNWHTYRVAYKLDSVKIYLDEDPTPVIAAKLSCQDVGGNQLRIGKQDRTTPIGTLFDYFLILEGETYAPGEGPPIPDGFLVGPGGNAVSANDIKVNSKFSVFPNPAGDIMRVRFIQENPGPARIDIYSLTGQKLETPFSRHLPAGSHEIQVNTSGLDAGLYLISVNGEYQRFIRE